MKLGSSVISSDLGEVYFGNSSETFCTKELQIYCMSSSPFVGLISYWNKANIVIAPVLDEIYISKSLTFLGCLYTRFKYLKHLHIFQSVVDIKAKTVVSQILYELSFRFF